MRLLPKVLNLLSPQSDKPIVKMTDLNHAEQVQVLMLARAGRYAEFMPIGGMLCRNRILFEMRGPVAYVRGWGETAIEAFRDYEMKARSKLP